MYLAYTNGAVWGLGKGLVGTTLIFYLAQTYGATGLALSFVIAAPSLAGVLRVFAPMWMDRVGNRKLFCATMFLASAAVLITLPLGTAPSTTTNSSRAIGLLVGYWMTYQLLEYMAMVALWSWFADLVPERIRGRFVGVHQAWTNGGRITGIFLGAGATTWWAESQSRLQVPAAEYRWEAYGTCALAGAVVLFFAVWPLLRMAEVPSPSDVGSRPVRQRWREMVVPFADPRFRRLLYYGVWFSLSNGLTNTVQRLFQAGPLDIAYGEKRVLDGGSRGLQIVIMPWCGRMADRYGNVSVLAVSQTLVASAMLFFLIATPEARWWILGGYAMWVAYAGINVALPNLMLNLSRPECSAAYTAAWFATNQLVYSLSVIAGGLSLDWFRDNFVTAAWRGWQFDHYALLFAIGFGLKLCGLFWILRIREPR